MPLWVACLWLAVAGVVRAAPLPDYEPHDTFIYDNGRVEQLISASGDALTWSAPGGRQYVRDRNFVAPLLEWKTVDSSGTRRVAPEARSLWPLEPGKSARFRVVTESRIQLEDGSTRRRKRTELWSCRVLPPAPITVPAGTFEALEIRCERFRRQRCASSARSTGTIPRRLDITSLAAGSISQRADAQAIPSSLRCTALMRTRGEFAAFCRTFDVKPSQTVDPPEGAIFSVGHSTLSLDELAALLDVYGVERLADIRTVPRSRHNPQFNGDTLGEALRPRGIEYVPLPALGGLRRARKDSRNTAWRNASFRGYADYMQTDEFARGLDELIALSREKRTAMMCAEAVPWRCHRSLVADALSVRAIPVIEILSATSCREHKLTPFARVEGGSVTYPPEDLLSEPQGR